MQVWQVTCCRPALLIEIQKPVKRWEFVTLVGILVRHPFLYDQSPLTLILQKFKVSQILWWSYLLHDLISAWGQVYAGFLRVVNCSSLWTSRWLCWTSPCKAVLQQFCFHRKHFGKQWYGHRKEQKKRADVVSADALPKNPNKFPWLISYNI